MNKNNSTVKNHQMDLWGKKKKIKINILPCFRWLPRVLSPLEKERNLKLSFGTRSNSLKASSSCHMLSNHSRVTSPYLN